MIEMNWGKDKDLFTTGFYLDKDFEVFVKCPKCKKMQRYNSYRLLKDLGYGLDWYYYKLKCKCGNIFTISFGTYFGTGTRSKGSGNYFSDKESKKIWSKKHK